MAPALGLGIPVTLLFVGVLLFSMHKSLNDWLLPLLTRLAHPHGNFLTRAALWPVAKAAQGVASVVNYVDHRLSVAAAHTMAPIAHFFSGIAAWITTLAYTSGNFAADVAHGFERLVTHTIPREIHSATRPLWRGIDHLERDFHQLRDRLRAFAKGIDTLIAHRILPAIRHLEHAIGVAIPRELGRIRHRVGTIETQLAKPSRVYLRRLARLLWLAGLLGLMLKTLAKRFPWLFCRKVKAVGNRVCGLDNDLLSWMIGGTLLLSGPLSLTDLARQMVEVATLFVEGLSTLLSDLVGVEEDYLGPSGGPIPRTFTDYLD